MQIPMSALAARSIDEFKDSAASPETVKADVQESTTTTTSTADQDDANDETDRRCRFCRVYDEVVAEQASTGRTFTSADL